jgi:hypothetical protein
VEFGDHPRRVRLFPENGFANLGQQECTRCEEAAGKPPD